MSISWKVDKLKPEWSCPHMHRAHRNVVLYLPQSSRFNLPLRVSPWGIKATWCISSLLYIHCLNRLGAQSYAAQIAGRLCDSRSSLQIRSTCVRLLHVVLWAREMNDKMKEISPTGLVSIFSKHYLSLFLILELMHMSLSHTYTQTEQILRNTIKTAVRDCLLFMTFFLFWLWRGA